MLFADGLVTLKQQHVKAQAKEHQLAVLYLVEQYMKQVCNIYTQQKVSVVVTIS